MNKIIPSIIILICIGVAFVDFGSNSPETNDTVVRNDISDQMKNTVSDMKKVIQSSDASSQKKNQAAALWRGAGDVWSILDINITTDKIASFNGNLFKIYSKKYSLADSFKGFSEAADKAFINTLGEYPKQMTKDDCKKMAELCYAIAWAFEQ